MNTQNWVTLSGTDLAKQLPSLPGWLWSRDSVQLSPIGGGLNNHNWRMTSTSGQTWFLKVPGAQTASFSDRGAARAASVLSSSAGLSPRSIFFDPTSGIEVTEFLDGYRPLTEYELAGTDAIHDVARAYKRLHGLQLLPRTRTVFDEIDGALDEYRHRTATAPAWVEEALSGWKTAAAALIASGSDLAPCHNDPNSANMMVSPHDRRPLQLVDFDYAANNDPSYELLGLLGFYPVPDTTRHEVIEEYYGRYSSQLGARMSAMYVAVLVRFGLWAVNRAGDADDYDYGKYGYMHLRDALAHMRRAEWSSELAQL